MQYKILWFERNHQRNSSLYTRNWHGGENPPKFFKFPNKSRTSQRERAALQEVGVGFVELFELGDEEHCCGSASGHEHAVGVFSELGWVFGLGGALFESS